MLKRNLRNVPKSFGYLATVSSEAEDHCSKCTWILFMYHGDFQVTRVWIKSLFIDFQGCEKLKIDGLVGTIFAFLQAVSIQVPEWLFSLEMYLKLSVWLRALKRRNLFNNFYNKGFIILCEKSHTCIRFVSWF